MLLLVCSAIATTAEPDQQPSAPGFYAGKLEAIQAKINANRLADAVEDYRALLALPGTTKLNFYDQLLFDYGRILLLSKDQDGALAAFKQAAEAGFADITQLTRNHTYDVLRTKSGFDEIVAKTRENLRKQRGIVVLELNTLHVEGDYSSMSFNNADSPRVQELRNRYHLKDIVANARTEWEKQLTMMDWVHRRWKHSVVQAADILDTLFILKQAESGDCFRCTEYAVVLADCLQAVGFPARVLRIERDGSSFGAIKMHYVTEVWNNTFGKWVVLDPQNNAYYQLGNTPLNASELRDRNLDDKFDVVEVIGLPTPWDNIPRDRTSMLEYYYHLSYYDPNSHFMRSNQRMRTIQLIHPREEIDVLFQQGPREENGMTRRQSDLYPFLNATDVQFTTIASALSKAMRLRIDLSHSMPWFDHFDISLNGKPLETRADMFLWDLDPGVNELIVTPVSLFGIKGHTSSLKLEWNTGLSHGTE